MTSVANDQRAREVAEHLNEQSGTVADARLVTVAGEVRPAAWFSQLRELPAGSRARLEAEAEGHSPTYVHEGLYVLGDTPLVYKQLRHDVVFREQPGDRAWMIAAWADEHAATNKAEYHPFGMWFLLQQMEEGAEHVLWHHEPVEVREL